jgi:hypothetical protein
MLAYTRRPDIEPSGRSTWKAIPRWLRLETLEIMLEIIYTGIGREVRPAPVRRCAAPKITL